MLFFTLENAPIVTDLDEVSTSAGVNFLNAQASEGSQAFTTTHPEEAKIKHLNQEEKIKREKIVAFINRLRYISPDHSIRFNQFLKESVFVWINRLIGIKCMELRGLILDKNDEITEIITTRPEYGNLSKWLRDFRVEEPERWRSAHRQLRLASDRLSEPQRRVWDHDR